MYSASATLQDYVSRACYALTGKWLEEYIDRRLEEGLPAVLLAQYKANGHSASAREERVGS